MDFLITLLLQEIEQKEKAALDKCLKKEKLPYVKSIHDFDSSSQLSIDERRVKEVLTGRYIHNGDNILLLGPPGVGKTHIAISMSFEAITNLTPSTFSYSQ
ncbi:ATP-binding protein [Terribacillus halophilus]|uniref:ATP-binding protein n=1 Tax=Terribacillus halophilus TaxID=361279 RepID=UPI002118E03D|nr:ATP-binding protein [Terribacillus halophilus]